MLVGQWQTVAAIATVLTVGWLLARPKFNARATASLSALGWGVCALTAPGLDAIDSGARIDAGSIELQLFALALAALSALAAVAAQTGHYPPDEDTDPADDIPDPTGGDRPLADD